MRACVSACACVRAFPSDCVFALVCVAGVSVRHGAVRALPSHGGDVRFIARPAPRVAAARAWWRSVPPAGLASVGRRRVSAAGATWTSRTLKAGWAARCGHTSVVDAAGAIYVIGGYGPDTDGQDVWASINGGAQAGLGQGGVVLRGY